ncbi:hypothetical protein C8046_03020 [Serinibacter arcticus]|uniref:Uncharacterized protein n=2 Tax=Serinibacter arcticus TaxID=1655435 RepID=A0A2U1ZS62_9MICO|nr:hypothetical protein C8046_03020 [Serinibacter arcticus]
MSPPVFAAIVGAATVAVAGCSGPAEPDEPTLDRAIEAGSSLIDGESRIQDVLITPHPGRGGAIFEVPGSELGRFFKMSCLGEGEVTLRINGGDRITESRCDDGTVGMGLDAEVDGTMIDNQTPVEVQLVAADDVYWVATTFTQTAS